MSVSDYELSITEGDNVIQITEGDIVLTLGMLVPTPSLLGVPPDGSFGDGQVTGWDNTTSVAQAIDELNSALKNVADTAGSEIILGTPTDGSFADGYVEGLTGDMRPVDAIDAINEGLLEVQADAIAPRVLAEASPGTDLTSGYISTFGPTTRTADAVAGINAGLADVVGVISATQSDLETTQDELDLVATRANTPGQREAGTPTGGWAAGYVPLDDDALITDGLNAVNVGLGQVSTLADQTADGLADLSQDTTQSINAIDEEVDAVSLVAHAPGQQPAGAATGGWQAGYSALGATTHLADGLNILNQGLGVVGATAAAPGTQAAGTPSGGWSSGYAAIGPSTAINGALNLLNAGLKSVADSSSAPQPAGEQAAGTPSGGWQTGYAGLSASTVINSALNLLNAGLKTVNDSIIAPQAAGAQAAGTPSGGWQTGYAAIDATTAINTGIDLLNAGLHVVDDVAQAALSAANTPGYSPIGELEGGWPTGYAAISETTPINIAVNALNTGLRTVALAAPKTGAPTDGSFADGLVTLSATATLADSIDTLNEAALGFLQNAYTFNTVTNASAGAFAWSGRARLLSASDGLVSVSNAANNAAGTFQAGLYQAANTDGAVQFGNSGKTNGLAIGADTLALKIAGTNALSWTYSTVPVGTLAGTLALSRAGTAAAPTLGFGGTDGLFAPATGDIGIATGGAQRLRINASGFWGIGTDPVAGSQISMGMLNALNTDYAINITSSDVSRWFRVRNDGRVLIQPYCQVNNVVLGIWGNSAIGSTSGAMLDFSNNIATTSYSLVSAAAAAANPTFIINAKSSTGTLDHTRWQQNGVTVATMANGGALSTPGFFANATQAAAGTVAWGDATLANGMAVNTTANSVLFRTNNTDALTIDNAQNQTIPATAGQLWNGRGGIYTTADGIFQMRNAAAASGSLIFGPSTSSGVRLSLGGTGLLNIGAGNSATPNGSLAATTATYSGLLAVVPTTSAAGRLYRTGATSATLDLASNRSFTIVIAGGCFIVGVGARVSTAITGAGLTGFSLGDAASTAPMAGGAAYSATAFGSNVSPALNSSVSIKDYTVPMPRAYGVGNVNITVTPVGAATFTAGQIRISVFYEILDAPT